MFTMWKLMQVLQKNLKSDTLLPSEKRYANFFNVKKGKQSHTADHTTIFVQNVSNEKNISIQIMPTIFISDPISLKNLFTTNPIATKINRPFHGNT